MATPRDNNQSISPLYSIRSRLLAFIFVVIVMIGVISLFLVQNSRDAFTEIAQSELTSVTGAQAQLVTLTLEDEVNLLRALADNSLIVTTVSSLNDTYPSTQALVNERLDEREAEWIAGDARAEAVQSLVVSSAVTTQALADFQRRSPGHNEIIVTDAQGGLVAASSVTDDFIQSDEEWWRRAWNNGDGAVYISPEIVVDATTQTQGIRISVPIENDGQIIGVLRTHYELAALDNLVAQFQIANSVTSGEFIVDANQQVIAENNIPEGLVQSFAQVGVSPNNSTDLINITSTEGVVYAASAQPLSLSSLEAVNQLNWSVVVVQTEAEIFAPITNAAQTPILLAFFTLVVVAIAAYFFSISLTRPLTVLTTAAERLGQERDYNARVQMDRQDEFGVLGDAFDTMASEVQDALETLERRVSARTADLETASEIAAAANQVRELQNLISLAVNLIRDRFDFYYVQIYLVDEAREYAVLADGTGYVGRRLVDQKHKIRLNSNSIVTRTINSNRSVLVDDTTSDPNYLQNTLLIDTRTELAVPLRAQNQVLGVIDIQHSEAHTFDDDSRRLFQTLADQLAITFENAQLLNSTEQRARELATVAEVSIEATTNLDLGELMRTVSKLTRDNFGLYHAHIYMLDILSEDLVLGGGAGEAGLLMMERGFSIALDDPNSIVARAARTGQQAISNDVTQAESYKPNDLLPNTRSELALPMIANDQLVGVLDVQSDQTNRFDEEDAQVLGILAAQVAVAVQNARTFDALDSAQQELERRENYYRSLIENASDIITLLSEGGIIVFESPSTEKILGYDPTLLVGQSILSYVHPNDKALVSDNIKATMEGDSETRIRFRWKHAAGHWVWLESFYSDLRSNPAVGALVVNSRDVTEAREREYERQTLLEITTALNNAQDGSQLLEAIVQYFEISGSHSSNLYIVDADENNNPVSLDTVAVRGDGAPVGSTYDLSEFPETMALWIKNPSEPTLIEDARNDARLDDATVAVYESLNIGALALLPLYSRNTWVGMVSLHWPERYQFSDLDKRILRNLIQQATSALTAYRLQERTQRRASELEVVAQVSANATSTLNVTELLNNVVNLAKERFGLYHAHVYLVQADGMTLRLAAGSGTAGEMMVSNNHQIAMSRRDSIVAQAARTREPAIANDITQGIGFLPNPLLPDTRAELAVPLTVGDELIGIFDVQSTQVGRFNEDDVRVQLTLANQVASAIQSAQAFAELQRTQYEVERRADEMEGVARVSAGISGELDIEQLLWAVADLTQETFGRYHAQIYLLDDEEEYLVLAAGAGDVGRQMVANKHAIGIGSDGVVARAAKSRMTAVVRDTSLERDFLPNMLLPKTRSELAIPIMYGDELLGILDIQDIRVDQFGDVEIQIKQTLANQVAIAIKNAEQFELTEQSLRETIANSQISETLRSNDDIETTLENVFEIVLGALKPDNIVYTNWNADEELWTGAIGVGNEMNNEIARSVRLPGYSIPHGLEALRRNEVVTVGNLPEYLAEILGDDQGGVDVVVEDIGIKSVMVIPLVVRGEERATAYLNYTVDYHSFTDDDRRLGSNIRNQLSSLFEQREAEAAVRQSQAEIERIFSSTSEMIGSASFDGYFTRLNDAWRQVTGFEFEELMAEPFISFVHPDDVELTAAETGKIVDGATTIQFTNRYRTKSGNYRWISWNSTPDAESELIHFVARDITEERSREQEQQTLLKLSQDLNVAQTIADVFAVIDEFALGEGMAYGVLMDIDSDPDGKPIKLTVTQKSDAAPLAMDMEFNMGAFAFSQLMVDNANNVFMIDDVMSDSRLDEDVKAAAQALGAAAYIGIPLYTLGSWVGLVGLHWSEPQNFSNQMHRILLDVKRQITPQIQALQVAEVIRQQSSIVTTSRDFIGIASPDGIVEYVNPAGLEWTGYANMDMRGNPIITWLPESSLALFGTEIMPTVIGEGYWRGEIEFVHRDGTPIPVDQTIFTIKDEAGNITNIATIVSDITERKEQEREVLRQSALVDNSTNFIGIASLDGQIEYINEYGLALVGFNNLDEALGQPIPIIHTESYAQRIAEEGIPHAMDTGAWEAEGDLLRMDGKVVPITQSIFIIRDESGNPQGIATIIADITERREREYEDRILFDAAQKLANVQTTSDVYAAITDYFADRGGNFSTLSSISVNPDGEPEWMHVIERWTNGESDIPAGSRTYLPDIQFASQWINNPTQALFLSDTTTDIRLDETTRQKYKERGIASRVILPLYYQSRWIGLITCNWNEQTDLDERDERIFSELMRQATLQIDAIRANEAIAQAREDAETLAEVNSLLSQAGDEAGILAAIVYYVKDQAPDLIQLSYMELDSAGNPHSIQAVSTWRDGAIVYDDPTLNVKYDLAVFPFSQLWINNPSRPMVIEDSEADERVGKQSVEIMRQFGIRSTAVLPLRVSGRWQGIITISWSDARRFDDATLNMYTRVMQTAAAVVASRRAYLASQQASEDAQLLYNISAELNIAQTEDDVLQAIIKHKIVETATSAAIGLFEGRNGNNATYVTIIADYSEHRSSVVGTQIPIEQAPFFKANLSDITLSENIEIDNTLDEASLSTLNRLKVKSFISTPLVSKNPIGRMTFYSNQSVQFTDRQQQLLRSIGQQASNALERINLLQQTTRRASELETVARVSAATTQLLSVEELLQSVSDLTKESFNLYHCHVYLLDDAGEILNLIAGSGEIGNMMRMGGHNIPMSRHHSIVVRAARTREATVSNDVRNEQDFLPNPMLSATRSEMAVPMIVGDELVGVLDVQSDQLNRFDDDDVRMKSTLADQIAVAVQNAQAFERERRTVEQLKEVDRLKQEFLANMSHELRTPLNSIIGYSEVLLDGVDGDLTEDAEEDVEAIHSSGKHLLNIINEILDLAKIDAGQMELRYQQMSLKNLLYEVVRSSQVLVKDRLVEMRLDEITPIPDAYIDRVRLNQVVLNLVGNAIKFTEEGEILVSYQMKDPNYILVEVKDSGVGMSTEQLEVIFERFRQVDQSSTRRAGGTGLGLTITKQLVEMHGGQIGVRSELGEGSTFWITLPTYDYAIQIVETAPDPSQPFMHHAIDPLPEAGD